MPRWIVLHHADIMFNKVGIRELRQQASSVLKRVVGGEVAEATDHGYPVARIVPLKPGMLDQTVLEGRGHRANRRPPGRDGRARPASDSQAWNPASVTGAARPSWRWTVAPRTSTPRPASSSSSLSRNRSNGGYGRMRSYARIGRPQLVRAWLDRSKPRSLRRGCPS
ncbi:MAG: type II toxin-antitoxin system prevent-host-death family antitoxin [Acidimicrobiaceae bacterium]|nr:type II toxin-antitoxin system prevent-host-death family antitoxin [Acidimicrobiaceae bacterium]